MSNKEKRDHSLEEEIIEEFMSQYAVNKKLWIPELRKDGSLLRDILCTPEDIIGFIRKAMRDIRDDERKKSFLFYTMDYTCPQ